MILFVLAGCKKNDSSTNQSATVTDIDGNIYHTVTIGTQVWMVENLKTTKFNDGSLIPLISDSASWTNLLTPGYCYFNNDSNLFRNTYGLLYNWFAINSGKLCPSGWHVPTDSDWNILVNNLGGDSVAGGKMKETSTRHWKNPNTGATNVSGFTALPGGQRGSNGVFYLNGETGYWWSATLYYQWSASQIVLGYDFKELYQITVSAHTGLSIRCLKN
jgi:uncharacterized protein (TIGR02145 family)